jgi:alpha-L-rhamnosidase
VCQAARDAGVPVVAVDSDGNVMEFADVAVELGVTCLYPSEVKAGNDLFALRRRHPQLVLVGWLEKEVINEGNEHRIEPEIMGKVPPLLEHGRYFPNGDHGIQPWATYGSLCRFMALLHEVCDNPEGEFLRERRRTPATAGANPLLRRLRAGQAQHIVTYGCSLTAGGAWVDQLRRILEQRYPGLVAITNSGQGAMWSRWGLENLEERVIAHRPDAVFIEFSMNDAFLPYDTSLEEARGNLAAMLDRIGQALPDCQAVLMVMNPPTGEHLEIRPRVEEYNQIYRDAARERGLLLIDHYPNWQRLLETEPDTFREYVPDGIHPAPLGCEKVITPAIVAALGLA